ncbi:alpha/beta hydrolase [Streptomyces sp. NPDC047081]|uniref:alpha/beta fold hydrolase n=1 Tax=Streptomyces sp. NPDC047081 TaxID=3154706 RepID=UPI0033F6D494
MVKVSERFVSVDGIRTHYLEAGEGPPLVLLHSGEFGGSARLTWEFNLAALSAHFRVLAPDWLGYGETDKIRDFVSGSDRMMAHIAAFVRTMALEEADFIGSSMGGTYLVRELATSSPRLPVRRAVITSGGGFVPDNEHRRAMLDYDGTAAAMQRTLQAMFVDPRWWNDQDYIRRRVESSLLPGAFETAAAARITSPSRPPRSDFGQPDNTDYESISVPVLVVAGEQDKLREPGYAEEIAARIPRGTAVNLKDAGHMANIEQAERWNRCVLEFLTAAGEPHVAPVNSQTARALPPPARSSE